MVWTAAHDDRIPCTSIGDAEEFDETVLRLASGAIHHDVDAGSKIRGDGFGMITEEGVDEFTGNIIRHLLR